MICHNHFDLRPLAIHNLELQPPSRAGHDKNLGKNKAIDKYSSILKSNRRQPLFLEFTANPSTAKRNQCVELLYLEPGFLSSAFTSSQPLLRTQLYIEIAITRARPFSLNSTLNHYFTRLLLEPLSMSALQVKLTHSVKTPAKLLSRAGLLETSSLNLIPQAPPLEPS